MKIQIQHIEALAEESQKIQIKHKEAVEKFNKMLDDLKNGTNSKIKKSEVAKPVAINTGTNNKQLSK